MQLLEKYVGWVVIAIFSLFVSVTFLQVVFRYLLSTSFGWIDEASRYGFIWMVCLAASIGARHGTHMAITLLEEMVPQSFRRLLRLLGDLGLIAFALLIGFGGWELMGLNMTSLTPALQIPIAYVQAILPIFAVLTTLFAIEHFIRLLIDRPLDAEANLPGDGA